MKNGSRNINKPLILLIALFLILSGIAIGVYGYLVTDPNANNICKSCHSIQPFVEDIANTSHGDMNCHTCHALTPGVFNELITYILYNPNSTQIKQKWNGNIKQYLECIKCHDYNDMMRIGIHSQHYEEEEFQSRACTECHNPHNPDATQNLCQNCHKGWYED